MKDYHQRFKEKFIREDDGLLGIGKYDTEEVLAFIDEVVAEERGGSVLTRDELASVEKLKGKFEGKREERAALTSKIEGMIANEHPLEYSYALTKLHDILTYLRDTPKKEEKDEVSPATPKDELSAHSEFAEINKEAVKPKSPEGEENKCNGSCGFPRPESPKEIPDAGLPTATITCPKLDLNNPDHRVEAMREAAQEANKQQRALMSPKESCCCGLQSLGASPRCSIHFPKEIECCVNCCGTFKPVTYCGDCPCHK